MKYFPLIWAGLWRKKARTILTLLSVLAAFLLFGMMQGFGYSFTRMVETARADVLFANNKAFQALPLSLIGSIEALDGVKVVSIAGQVPSYY